MNPFHTADSILFISVPPFFGDPDANKHLQIVKSLVMFGLLEVLYQSVHIFAFYYVSNHSLYANLFLFDLQIFIYCLAPELSETVPSRDAIYFVVNCLKVLF